METTIVYWGYIRTIGYLLGLYRGDGCESTCLLEREHQATGGRQLYTLSSGT